MAEVMCKACGKGTVLSFLSYGKLPLGNAFLNRDQVEGEEKFDLDLGFCTSCTLVQQIRPPPMSSLARVYRNYHYIPVGGTLRNNLSALGKSIVDNLGLDLASFFVDIGSNDGALLSSIKDRCKVLGIEPAVEISEMARKAGVETITDFFSHELVERIVSERGKADVATATQVLQHIPDVRQFIKDVNLLLKPDGIFVVEGRYFGETIRKHSFDTVYHEMQYFFTLGSLVNLLGQVEMEIFRAELVDVYGGSLRVYAKKKQNKKYKIEDSVSKTVEFEKNLGLDNYETYNAFANAVFRLRDELHNLVVKLKTQGKIAGYGAPSTGTTLLNFSQIGNEYIDYIVDDSPLKQGLLTPGTHIPIVNSEVLAEKPPDYLLLIAWRLQDEILPKIQRYRDGGMSVVIPLPKVEILK